MRKILSTLSIFTCLVLLLTGCNNACKIDCEKLLAQAGTHMNNYYYTHDTSHLDSALIVLKQLGDKSDKYNGHIASREVFIYYELKDWDKATDAVDRMELGSSDYFIEMKKILKNKILAKSVENDIDERNRYYNAIIKIFEDLIDKYDSEVIENLLMDNVEDIQDSITDGLLPEMFYYKALVNGKEAAVAEIDSLQQKTSGNPQYFNYLKNIILKDKIHVYLMESTIDM
jgi:lipoprotein